jgi:hypothetical protein
LQQFPTDVEKWRLGKEAAIADLKLADTKLDTVLGPKDPLLNLDLEKPKENAPAAIMQLRAQVLSSLAKIEYNRSNAADDQFAVWRQ